MRVLGLVLLAAACGPSGLTIEVVVDDPAIARVELFAAEHCYENCPRSTVGPGLPSLTIDDAWIVEDPLPFTVAKQDFADGVAGFRIESDHDTQIGVIVAVGYDAQDQIRWSWAKPYVHIASDTAERWQVHMWPTTAIGPTVEPQPAGAKRAATWPAPRGLPSCLLLEHWLDNFVPNRDLIGPAEDLDCDGVAEQNECAPWIPNASGAAPAVDQTSCLTFGGTNICMLGGPECNEDPLTQGESCVPVDPGYCAPSSLCSCTTSPDPLMCLRDRSSTDTTIPFVKCTIHIDASGAQCESNPIELDLGAVLSGGSNKCKDISVNDADRAINLSDSWHIGEGKLRFSSFTTPCKTGVHWETGDPMQTSALSVLDTAIDNGYHLVLPIRAEFRVGCDASSLCAFSGATTDSMFQCVERAPMMLACSPDPDNGCPNGPKCGNGCCKSGEVCGPDGCSCAGGAACPTGEECAVRLPTQCGELCCGSAGNPCPF